MSSALLVGSVGTAAANRELRAVEMPAKTAPITSWTPIQQLQLDGADPYGYYHAAGFLALADELGDRLSHLGRASIVAQCFRGGNERNSEVLSWAICRDDFVALDLAKAEAEIVAAGVSQEDRERAMAWITEEHERAREVVATFDEAARTDRGLKKVRADVEAAKKEWAAYVGAHRADVELYLTLKDAVRTGKRNDPAFAGCDAKTRPRFEKHVRSVAKKIPWETDSLEGYMYYLVDGSIDGYITTVSWAACAFSVHPAADPVLAQAASTNVNLIRAGWRTVAIGKLSADDYKPRFDDSSFYLRRDDLSAYITHAGLSKSDNPTWGEVKKVKKHDDELTIIFAMGQIEGGCLRWVTRRGEKECAERGDYENEVDPVDVPLAYAAGIKPGVSMKTGGPQFPMVVWKGKKILAIFGVTLK
ncbi:MAG TPA: hypothetical protein VM261_33480 [Kofleriaceae bacterium]|nr:hypothetical protein [Kofleriaceae bacterium]